MSAPTPVTLIGFRHSVYQRIVRIVLHEKEVPYIVEDIDPFDAEQADRLRTLHPFGRVPALRHGGFHLYETSAITRYVDLAFNGPNLVPGDPRAAARMAQVIAIWDAYGYHPMVRQVFARRTFGPWADTSANEEEIARGMEGARTVLAALEDIAKEGNILTGRTITLADCHSGAMIDYFARTPEGAMLLETHPHLLAWWQVMRERASIAALDL